MKNRQTLGFVLSLMLTVAMVVNGVPSAAIGEAAKEVGAIKDSIVETATTPSAATDTADDADAASAVTSSEAAPTNKDAAAAESTSTTEAPAQESSSQQLVPQEAEEIAAQADYKLDDYITSQALLVSHDNGATFTEDLTGIQDGDIVRVRMDWKFPNSLHIHAGDTFTCSLPNSPENVLAYSEQTGNITNGSDIDGFFVLKDNQLTLTYTVDEGSDVTGDISFDGKVNLSKYSHSHGGETDIVFPGGGTQHIEIAPTISSLNAWKNATQDSNDRNLWHYVVAVSATGENTNVRVSDQMGSLISLKDGNVRVATDYNGDKAYAGLYSVRGASAGSHSFEVVIDKMVDQTLYVIYDATADSEELGWATAHNNKPSATNTVRYESEETDTPKETSTTIRADKTWDVKKDAAVDKTSKEVVWTITISGGSNGDVSLAVIDDDLGSDLAAPSSIQVKQRANGGAWVDSSWNVSWSDLESGRLTVPANSNGIDYQIVYRTSYFNEAAANSQRSYTNKVKVTPHKDPDNPITVSKEVKIGDLEEAGGIKKACLSGSNITYTPKWRTTVTANSDISNVKVTDQPQDNQVIDMDSLVVSYDKEGTKVVDPSLYTVATTTDDEGVKSFTLTSNVTMTKGAVLYLTYNTKFRAGYVPDGKNGTASIGGWNKAQLTYEGARKIREAYANYAATAHLTKKFIWDDASARELGRYDWRLDVRKVDGSTNTVIIQDTLPTGHELAGTDVTVTGKNGAALQGVTLKDNGNGTATFRVEGAALDALKAGDIAISYATRWVDINEAKDGQIVNKARAIIDDVVEPEVSASAWITKPKVLDKSYVYNQATAPLVDYTIKVNVTAQTLNGGAPLALTDVMGSALDLQLDSIKVDGKSIHDVDGYSFDYDPKTHTMTVIVPDATSFVFTYSARVNLAPGESLNSANSGNTATLTGHTKPYESDHTEFNVEVIDPQAHTSSTDESLRIYKYADRDGSGNVSHALKDASFSIFEVADVTRDGKNWTAGEGKLVTSTTSAANGYCHAVDGLRKDTIYRVVETVVPQGYVGSDPIYVVFPGDDSALYDEYEGITVNGAALQSEGHVQTGTLFISNTPLPRQASASIEATKTISGRDFRAGDSLTFAVEPLAGAPAPVDAAGNAVASVTINPTSGSSAKVDLGKVNLTSENLGGVTVDSHGSRSRTFDYRVSEVKGTAAGMTYDGTTYLAHVTLSEDEDLNLATSVSYEVERDGSTAAVDGITFANSYTATSASVALSGSKVVSNPKGGAGCPTLAEIAGAFTFTISSDDADAPMPTDESGKVVTTVSNDASGNVAFPKMTFGDELLGSDWSADGTRSRDFAYTIHEGGSYAGLTNDGDKSVTVRVADDGSGSVSASVVRGADSALDFTFANSYASREASASLSATKTISGRDFRAGDEFTFTAEALGGAPSPAAATKTVTPTSGSSVAVGFGAIALTTDDLAGAARAADGSRSRTFDYRVTEAKGTQAGVTYDGSVYVAHVTLSEDASGALSTSVSYEVERDGSTAAVDGITFANSYSATPASFSLHGHKSFNGSSLEGFVFNLTGPAIVDGKAQETAQLASATSDATGAIQLPELTYSYDDLRALRKAGYADYEAIDGGATYTLHYAVAEDTSSLASRGIAGVRTTQLANVIFTERDGALSATVDYGDQDELSFVNAYVTSNALIDLMGNKVVSNPEGSNEAPSVADIAGKFTFTISSADEGAPLPVDDEGNVAATATNDSTGQVSFGVMTFDATLLPSEWAADGTRSRDFTYTIHEDGSVDCVTNDGDKSVVLRLTDDGHGNLSVAAIPAEGTTELFDFTFVNKYEPGESVTPGGPGENPPSTAITPTTPETPTTPTTPTTPSTPDVPSTPETPSTPTTATTPWQPGEEQQSPQGSGYAASETIAAQLPKTSDPTPTWLGLAAIAGIALVVVALLVRGRKRND